MERILVVSQNELAQMENLGEQIWEQAFAVGGALMVVARLASGTASAWHDHGARNLYGYVAAGSGRLEFEPDGPGLDFEAGQFIFIPAGTVHRLANPGQHEQVIYAVLHGPGVPFHEVDGPPDSPQALPVVAGDDDLVLTHQTENLRRETPFPDRDVLVFRARAAGGAKAGWHHHGENIYYGVFTEGKAGRIEYGPGGREAVDLLPGEFIHVPTGMVHRDVNHTDGWHQAVVWLIGDDPRVVNVDSP